MYDARYIHLKLKQRYAHLTDDEEDEYLLADDVIKIALIRYCKFCE